MCPQAAISVFSRGPRRLREGCRRSRQGVVVISTLGLSEAFRATLVAVPVLLRAVTELGNEWLTQVSYAASTIASYVIGLGILSSLVTIAWHTTKDIRQRRRERQREREQRERETKGLLTLLDIDVELQRGLLSSFRTVPDWILEAPADTVEVRPWEDTRVRLSQLLEQNEFATIALYFNNLKWMNMARIDREARRAVFGSKVAETIYSDENFKKFFLKEKLPMLQGQHARVQEVIRKYVPEKALKQPL